MSDGGSVLIKTTDDGNALSTATFAFGGTTPTGCPAALTLVDVALSPNGTGFRARGAAYGGLVNVGVSAAWDLPSRSTVVGVISADALPGQSCPSRRLTWAASGLSTPTGTAVVPRAATTTGFVYAVDGDAKVGTASITTSADGLSLTALSFDFAVSVCSGRVWWPTTPTNDRVVLRGGVVMNDSFDTAAGSPFFVAGVVAPTGMAGGLSIPASSTCPALAFYWVAESGSGAAGSGTLPPPTASVPAPSPTPGAAVLPPALFFGREVSPGARIEASIRGITCGASVADSTGRWSISIAPTAPCEPRIGEVVRFTVGGTPANETGVWRSGAIPSDVNNGLRLTTNDRSTTAAPGTFSAGPSLPFGRDSHTATRVPSGDIVIAGGVGSAEVAAGISALRYSVATNVFVPVGGDRPARLGHAAVALADGRVLIVGGVDANDIPIAAALVIDSQGTVWGDGGRQNIAKIGQALAVLPSGRVLYSGGAIRVPLVNRFEDSIVAGTYDPASRDFGGIGQPTLFEARSFHTATLLRNGTVLIAGGARRATAELFDISRGQFTRTAGLMQNRSGHQATLLVDGRVLITGGYATALDGSLGEAVQMAEIFDPATNKFEVIGSMTVARVGHTATLLQDGTVLITGGASSSVDGMPAYSSTEIFDPVAGVFRAGPVMASPRVGHTATALVDGRVIIIGGATGVGNGVLRPTATEIYGQAVGASPATPPTAAPTGIAAFAGTPVFGVSGQAFAVFSGGSVDQLEAAARTAGSSGVWAQAASGDYLLFVVGGPTFINTPFRSAFASGIRPNTPMTLTK